MRLVADCTRLSPSSRYRLPEAVPFRLGAIKMVKSLVRSSVVVFALDDRRGMMLPPLMYSGTSMFSTIFDV